jgi:hypothetical protein
MTEKSVGQENSMHLRDMSILSSKFRYMDRIISQATEIELHANNVSREYGLYLSTSWKLLISCLPFARRSKC